MPFGAPAAGPPLSRANAGAAPGISVKARHDTSPDMTIPGEFDPRRMRLPLLYRDFEMDA
jgi:hypothetical protein